MPQHRKQKPKPTKNEQLINYLRRYKAIDAHYASAVFRIYNLPQHIAKLRKQGHTIKAHRKHGQLTSFRYIQNSGGATPAEANNTGHQTSEHTAQPTPVQL